MFTDVGVVPFSVYGAALSGVAPSRKELFGKEEG